MVKKGPNISQIKNKWEKLYSNTQNITSNFIFIFNKVRLTFLYSLLPPCFAWNENQENTQSSSVFMALFSLTKTKDKQKESLQKSSRAEAQENMQQMNFTSFIFLINVLSRALTCNTSKFVLCLKSKCKHLFKLNSQTTIQE